MTEIFRLRDPDEGATLGDITLDQIPPYVLMDGFRLNPALEQVAFPSSPENGRPDGELNRALSADLANEKGLFQWVQGEWLPELQNFNFLYNFIDTSTGRELQNAPIHNISGLGKSNGERPFRMLAKPLAFLPRSSVRIQVEEKSERIRGRLYMVLHGYKILGAAGVSEEHLRGLYQRAFQNFGPQAAARRTIAQVEQQRLPSSRLVPFDYVGSLELSGEAGRIREAEIPINVEGGFVATGIGYSLAAEDPDIRVRATGKGLPTIKLSDFPINALKHGFRIKDAFQAIAFQNGGLNADISVDTLNQMFEPLSRPRNVRFLYSISDTGTGRNWQNEPVLNIAGLGIADGDRPFRNLAWPMHFLPRSTVYLRIREIFGLGRLYIVFQGYKMLGVPL